MSCVRESSPPLESAAEIVRHESKRRRFNPLQGLRRIFRKKSRASNVLPVPDASSSPNEPSGAVSDQMSPADPMRSRSTSQLSDSGDPASLKNRGLHSTLLSLSHDSVFTAESNGSEVDASSCLSVQKAAQSSVRAELLDVVRRRKLQREDTSDDEDLGLPRSPLSTSPHHKTITNHSTCSEGSLLSMGNAELNISVTLPSVPKLSHSAAKHKMAVRPKRTHGAPRKRKHQIGAVTALPATPEVNEDTSSARTALSDSEDTLADHPKQEAAKSTDHLNKGNPTSVKSVGTESNPVIRHHVTVNIDVSKAFDSESEQEFYLLKGKDLHTVGSLQSEGHLVDQSNMSTRFKSNEDSQGHGSSGVPQGSPIGPNTKISPEGTNKNGKKLTKLKYSVGFDLNNLSVASDEGDSWGPGGSPPHTFYRRLSQIRPPVDAAASLVAARKKSLLERNNAKNSHQNTVTRGELSWVHSGYERTSSKRIETSSNDKTRTEPRYDHSVKERTIQIDRNSLSPSQCVDLKIPPSPENYRHVCEKSVTPSRMSYGPEVYSSLKSEKTSGSSLLEALRKRAAGREIFPGKNSTSVNSVNRKTYTDDLSNLYTQTHNIPKVSLRRNSKGVGDKETFVFYRPRVFPREESNRNPPVETTLKCRATSPPPLQKPVYQPTPYVPSLTLLQAKSSSLPVGALPPTSLARSHSNATPPGPPGVKVKSSLSDDYLGERKEESFFSRLLLRRSGKKKKPEEDTVAELPPVIPHKRMDEKGQYLVDMNNISSKQYPSCRQRMEPLNIPLEEAPVNRMHVSYVTSLPEPGDEMDGIQVAKPDAPYLFRSMYAGEFTPVQETFSYKPGDVSPPSSMEVTVPEIHRVPPHQESEDSPPVPEVHSASTQEVTQPVQDTESRDVLVDETVIANVFELTTRSGGSQENLPCLLNETESHQIIISHKSADNVTTDSKPNVETKPGDGRPTITADKPNVTLDRPNIPQKPTACVIPVRPSGRQKPNAPPDTQPSQISKVFLNNSSGEDVVEKEPSSPVQDEHNETSPGQEDIKPVQARDRIQHLSLNLVDTIASPGRESSPLGCSSPRKSVPPSPTLGSSPRKSVPASPNLGSLRKPPGSPLREGSPLKQRSPLREISPFKIATSPGHDLPSPYLSRRLPLASPVTVQGNFFPDETQDGIQRGKEVPSPVTPKDLVLPSPTSPISRGKDSVFSKEIPSPVMPRDVFQFNTPGTPGNTSERESKIGKSASFTEQKKDVPIPAPRISLRKDTSLPSMQTDKSMPEYRKVHVSTQDTKKSMSSSCESLDMQDQVQSSSYSDSCDSMDNIDQWRGGTDNKQTPWRKTDIPWRNRYSEISSSDSDDKQLSITPDGSDIEKKIEEEEISIVQLRRKSFAKDWTRSGDSPPRPLRQKSLEPELLNTSTRNEVVLRRKSLSKEMIKTVGDSDEPPELLKVFARRSLKIPKDFDVNENTVDSGTGSKDSDKENEANTTNEKRSDDRTDKKRLDDKTSENINVQFPLDNDRIKLKKSYESIIITTNKNLDNEDRTKSHQKDLIKPFSGVKVNINEKPLNNMNEAKPLNSNTKVNINEVKPLNTVVKTVNLNTEVIRTEEPTKESPSETNVNKTDVMDNMKGFKKIQQRREEWEQRMQQARKTQP
ncbi:hypothetical protein M8J75_001850 [Diaphorina citri]|nr:hypothetical protein M8J75_001850 [Diaphorina citri]